MQLWFSVDIDTAAAVSLEDEGHRPRLYGGALTLNLGSVRNSPNPGADGWANALDAEWTNVASENSPSGSSGAGDVRQAASDPRGPDAAVLRSAAEAGAEGARAEGLNPASLKAYGGWRVPAAEITLAQAIQDPAALSVTPVAVAENLSGATVAAGGAGVTLVSDPSGLFEIGPDGAALKLKADRFLDFEAPSRSYTVTLSADDGQGGTVRKTVTFTASVTDANEAPRAAATGNRAEGGQNKILFGTLPAGSDEDGGELTYELVAPVPSLTLLSTGAFSYEPQADFNGEVRFDYVAVDPGGARSEPQTFVIAVVPGGGASADPSAGRNPGVGGGAPTLALGSSSPVAPEVDALVGLQELDEGEDVAPIAAAALLPPTFDPSSVGTEALQRPTGLGGTAAEVVENTEDTPVEGGANRSPVAKAGDEYLIAEGEDLTLDASATTDPDLAAGDGLSLRLGPGQRRRLRRHG